MEILMGFNRRNVVTSLNQQRLGSGQQKMVDTIYKPEVYWENHGTELMIFKGSCRLMHQCYMVMESMTHLYMLF